jgi:hypothetical protein
MKAYLLIETRPGHLKMYSTGIRSGSQTFYMPTPLNGRHGDIVVLEAHNLETLNNFV